MFNILKVFKRTTALKRNLLDANSFLKELDLTATEVLKSDISNSNPSVRSKFTCHATTFLKLESKFMCRGVSCSECPFADYRSAILFIESAEY